LAETAQAAPQPAPAETAQPAAETAPSAAETAPEGEISPDSGGEFEKKSQNFEENADFYAEKEYTKNSSEFVPSQTKSRFREIFPILAACIGAVAAVIAGLFGFRFRRKRKEGTGKDGYEN
jgi:hypothetical protein